MLISKVHKSIIVMNSLNTRFSRNVFEAVQKTCSTCFIGSKTTRLCLVFLKAGFHMIAYRRSQIAIRSAIVCDRLRSYGNILLRSSAILRSRSQTIAEDRTMFYLLRSSAIAEVCFHIIVDDRTPHCDLRSAIIWKPALTLLNVPAVSVCSWPNPGICTVGVAQTL